MKKEQITEILLSLVTDQHKQMVEQIDEYGIYDFWADYREYLSLYVSYESRYVYFTDAVISYNRIKAR